jgi:hypothetical protein
MRNQDTIETSTEPTPSEVGCWCPVCKNKNSLRVYAEDRPGPGGANHLYRIVGFNTWTNPSCPFTKRYGSPSDHATILFQNGPIKEVGMNGLTHEALIEILIDRLEAFQEGPYACFENEMALRGLELALDALQARTRKRIEEGTEGTHEL